MESESGITIASYYYDPFGRRLWKEVGGIRSCFYYNDEGLAGEYDASGNELRTYGYHAGSAWSSNPLFVQQDGVYYWYQNGHLGTPQKIIAENGAIVWAARYDAFGRATVEIAVIENNLRFPGQYFDVETGLHYNRHRYYDPEIGRYISTDPIGLAGGINLYAYVRNDPVNAVDPWGLVSGCDVLLTPLPLPLWMAPAGDLICPSVSGNPDPVFCTLMFSDEQGDEKSCFYECPASSIYGNWEAISVDKCDECSKNIMLDNNKYGPPIWKN